MKLTQPGRYGGIASPEAGNGVGGKTLETA